MNKEKGTVNINLGKLDARGNVEGVIVKGAQPYSVFQGVIDQHLNE